MTSGFGCDDGRFGLNIAYLTDPSGVYIELTEGYDEY